MRLLAFLLPLILASTALAQTGGVYSREPLVIYRETPPTLPWQQQSEDPLTSGVSFEVETRNATTYYQQKDWFNLSSFTDESGLLLLFSAPGISPIVKSQHYAPMDILFIDDQGAITGIYPQVRMSQLQQQILPQSPTLAFLFLKGGIAQHLGLQTGDRVAHSAFKKASVQPQPTAQTQQAVPQEAPVILLQDEPRLKPMMPTAEKPSDKIVVKKRKPIPAAER